MTTRTHKDFFQLVEKTSPEGEEQESGHGKPKVVAKVDEVRVDLETGTITLRIAKDEMEHN
jgi:Ca2+/H+ antiporter